MPIRPPQTLRVIRLAPFGPLSPQHVEFLVCLANMCVHLALCFPGHVRGAVELAVGMNPLSQTPAEGLGEPRMPAVLNTLCCRQHSCIMASLLDNPRRPHPRFRVYSMGAFFSLDTFPTATVLRLAKGIPFHPNFIDRSHSNHPVSAVNGSLP